MYLVDFLFAYAIVITLVAIGAGWGAWHTREVKEAVRDIQKRATDLQTAVARIPAHVTNAALTTERKLGGKIEQALPATAGDTSSPAASPGPKLDPAVPMSSPPS